MDFPIEDTLKKKKGENWMINNGSILYLYDATMTNPNGDPDEENRPRMDSIREINLVTDLRLKRYIRNYALDMEKELFVQKVGDKSVTAEERIEKISTYDEMLETFYDMRVFGATVPKKGDNRSFTGPVQFNWGYSLNKVELIEASITSHFASKSGNNQGSIGKDYRVKYSLLAFSGVVSGMRAEKTKMTNEDLIFLDEAMVNAIPSQATRSKVGQYPRLYMRVVMKDNKTFLKDLRSFISISKDENVFKISDVDVDITKLVKYLSEKQDKIEEIKYFVDDEIKLINEGSSSTLENAFNFVKMTKAV